MVDKPLASAEPAASGAAVQQVDLVGFYEDFNWSGDGQFRKWQCQTEHGARKCHIGTATTEHAAEVNWPGPVLLVEFSKKP